MSGATKVLIAIGLVLSIAAGFFGAVLASASRSFGCGIEEWPPALCSDYKMVWQFVKVFTFGSTLVFAGLAAPFWVPKAVTFALKKAR
jgi:hypothetical protein